MISSELFTKLETVLPKGYALRQVLSLKKKFAPNKDTNFEKALWVAICLYALEKENLAVEFLEAFVDDIGEEHKGYQLGNKLTALATLAYMLRHSGLNAEAEIRIKKYISLVEYLSAGDYDWFYDRAKGIVDLYHENEQLALLVTTDNTTKYDILGHCWQIRRVLDYLSVVEYLDSDGQRETLSAFDDILQVERVRLANALLNRA